MSSFTDFMNSDEIPWADNNSEYVNPSFPENADKEFSKMVSGIGIQSNDDAETSEENAKLLSKLNAGNKELVEKEGEEKASLEKEREEADRQIRKEAQEKWLRERYEREMAEKKKREEEEAVELARMEAEAEAKRQANPLFKLANSVTKMKQEMMEKRLTKSNIKKEKSANENRKDEKMEEIASDVGNPLPENKEEKKSEASAITPKSPAKSKDVSIHANKNDKKKKEKPEKGKEKEEDWKFIATHDGLTKLGNQMAYEEAKKNADPKRTAIIICDINNLKVANDNYGHSAGNRLITATAEILFQLFKEDAYRIGGDEFAILLPKISSAKEADKTISKNLEEFQKSLSAKAKDDPDKLVYAVSTGYCIADGKMSVEDIHNEADKRMYANKTAYKKAHPNQVAPSRRDPSSKPALVKDYDSMLNKEQRILKETVRENHSQANCESTERILLEIQKRQAEILAIMIASPTFDHLFIIQDVGTFVNLVIEMDSLIDYSYLYVVYEGGPQYYGTDEYYSEVTHLFEAIAKELGSGRVMTSKDIAKIKGINIFKNIYIE